MVADATPDVNDKRVFATLMVALIALAWLALWAWSQSSYGRLLDHDQAYDVGIQNASLLLLFVGGWILMTAAMMLPTSLPLITMFRGLVRQRPDRTTLVALLIVGYLGVWAVFGVLVHLADWTLHKAVMKSQNAWLESYFCFRCNPWILPAATFLVAGVYQFLPLKHYCLNKCRAPLNFIPQHGPGRRERGQAFRLGTRHGLLCLGCCWPMMLLMFAIGAGSLGWMLVLGVVMGLEKNTALGWRLCAPLGVLLIVAGLAVAWPSTSIFP